MISMKTYNKLVRDKIPDIMMKNKASPVIHILDNEEYFMELNRKLKEELTEYLENYDLMELVDIEEIIRAILDYKGVTYEEFDTLRQEKVLKRGAFKKKIFLEKEE